MTQSHPSRWNVVQLNKYLCGIFSFSFEFEWIQSRWRREEEEEGERKRFNVPVAAGWCRVSWRSGRNRCGRSHPVDCVWRNGQSWTGQSRPNCAWPSRNPVPCTIPSIHYHWSINSNIINNTNSSNNSHNSSNNNHPILVDSTRRLAAPGAISGRFIECADYSIDARVVSFIQFFL